MIALERAICDIGNGRQTKEAFQTEALAAIESMPFFVSKVDRIGNKPFFITDDWYWFCTQSSKLPKTDLVFNKCEKVSLKYGKNSQFMSSGTQETLALLTLVARHNDIDETILNPVKNLIDEIDTFGNIILPGPIKKVSKMNPQPEAYVKLNQLHSELTKELQTLFLIEDYGLEILRESISGKIKFGDQSQASCDYLLSVGTNGKPITIISTHDISSLKSLYKSSRLLVKFKSDSQKRDGTRSGNYIIRNVIGLMHEPRSSPKIT